MRKHNHPPRVPRAVLRRLNPFPVYRVTWVRGGTLFEFAGSFRLCNRKIGELRTAAGVHYVQAWRPDGQQDTYLFPAACGDYPVYAAA